MTNRPEIVAEITRLEGELRRISKELDALRMKVEPTRTGRTQAFAGVTPSTSALANGKPPSTSATLTSATSATSEMPATQPAPTTSGSERGSGSSASKRERTIPPATASSTGKRVVSPTLGIDGADSSPPARRESSPRDLGRYGFVNSDKPKSAGRR